MGVVIKSEKRLAWRRATSSCNAFAIATYYSLLYRKFQRPEKARKVSQRKTKCKQAMNRLRL